MDDFAKKFLGEATDLINDLERSVLALEGQPENDELTNEVFRIMHSLKGGGAMFGFIQVSEFTHNMENIYDEVRSGNRNITKHLLDITFESVDHLRNLLSNPEDTETISKHKSLLRRIENIISTKEKEKPEQSEKKTKAENKNKTLFYISFKPHSNFFDFGNNPFFLIDDLHEMGVAEVVPRTNNIPPIEDYDHTISYCSWDIVLITESTKTDIQEVFIFAEDECDLKIIKLSDNTLIDANELTTIINKANTGESLDLKIIKKLLPVNYTDSIQHIKEVKEQINKFSKESEISSIRIATEKIDDYMNLVSELVTAQATLKLLITESSSSDLQELSENIENITYRIRDNALSISLIPIENIIVRFRRLIRDLSNSFDKKIEFETKGTDTRVDKTLLQIITDPMMHIIRNSIDHGIESTDERIIEGKPETGKILLSAFHSGSNVHIVIEDDGRGIDSEKIKKKAIEKGLISEDAVLSKKETFDILFKPGFSTAKIVTDVSGRGVGMDVLKRKIADVRGDVKFESEIGVGTKITLMLPMSLSIINGLLVKINNSQFIVPLSDISKIHEVETETLNQSFNDIAVFTDKQIPFFFIRNGLQLEGEQPDIVQFLEVKYQQKIIGLVFDEIIGEYQAVLKPLSKLYRNQKMMSAASILGDGSVALVLDTNRLISKLSLEKEELSTKGTP